MHRAARKRSLGPPCPRQMRFSVQPSPVEAAAQAVRYGLGMIGCHPFPRSRVSVRVSWFLSGMREWHNFPAGVSALTGMLVAGRVICRSNGCDGFVNWSGWTFVRPGSERPIRPLSAGVDSMGRFWQLLSLTSRRAAPGLENGISRTRRGPRIRSTGAPGSHPAPLSSTSLRALVRASPVRHPEFRNTRRHPRAEWRFTRPWHEQRSTRRWRGGEWREVRGPGAGSGGRVGLVTTRRMALCSVPSFIADPGEGSDRRSLAVGGVSFRPR